MTATNSQVGAELQLRMSLNAEQFCTSLLALHRAPDSFISFTRRIPGSKWENLFAVRADELKTTFPLMAPWLAQNAYFTVNGTYRGGYGCHEKTGLARVERNEENLRYLNACYVDLDCGRENSNMPAQRLTWRDVAEELCNLIQSGELPQSSMFARSGRGAYVFWTLRDDNDPEMPPRRSRLNLQMYKGINRAICRRLAHLAADTAATDAARVLRVPGTRHSGASPEAVRLQEDRAIYRGHGNGDGRIFTYTLPELADFFGVRGDHSSSPSAMSYGVHWSEVDEARREQGYSERETLRPGTVPNRRRGREALHGARARDWLRLEEARGGWEKGRRKWHLMRYAEFLRGASKTEAEIYRAVRTMAANCRPPYPSDGSDTPLKALVAEAHSASLYKYSDETLCRLLGITASLAREYALETIMPEEVRLERKPPRGGYRGATRQARMEWLRQRIAGLGNVNISARQIASELAAAGIRCSHVTISKELKLLGVNVNRRGAGRPQRG